MTGSVPEKPETGEISLDEIRSQVEEAVKGLLEVARLKPGQILVLGCSTSEVQGKRIGSFGNVHVAEAILEGVEAALSGTGVYLAVQCCEHLNRALVVERETCEKYNLTEVTVLPVPNAGGATAATAVRRFKDPVVVESIQAHAGIDIGDTFIGMHLRPVAVPVRLPIKAIGYAHLTMARTRPKLIGGKRAVYSWDEVEERFGKGVTR
ncbi:MAG TPA: TIGR01440 family protein [Firmicutes bacterium]|nr:TIGR01440 family protein [Candidatus Fermentithermobacillaceae bacterium]